MGGSFMSKYTDPNIKKAMAKWFVSEKTRICNPELYDTYRYVSYNNENLKIYGTNSYGLYGFDEVFLSCYLYPKVKNSCLTIKFRGDLKRKNTLAFDADIGSINNPSLIYLNCLD
jgi:hypothetical protein